MKNPVITRMKTRGLGHIALALALSVGTVGGMMSFAALTEPAMAQNAGNGGNGGNGGASGNAGGEGGGVSAVRLPGTPNAPKGRFEKRRERSENCNGGAEMRGMRSCKFTPPRAARVVSINGFANCAVVQQLRNPDGSAGAFYCLRPM